MKKITSLLSLGLSLIAFQAGARDQGIEERGETGVLRRNVPSHGRLLVIEETKRHVRDLWSDTLL